MTMARWWIHGTREQWCKSGGITFFAYLFIFSGDAAVIAKHSLFCVDDPIEGISLHRLDSGARVRTYPIAVTKSIRPRQVAFAEGCSKIVSGSDHGIVYVFDREGSTAEKLKIESEDWIQTVMVSYISSGCSS
jgi:hypothetical protein